MSIRSRSLSLNRPPSQSRIPESRRRTTNIMNRFSRTMNRVRGRRSYHTVRSNRNVLGMTIEELNSYNNHPNNIRFKNIHINRLPEPYKSKMDYLKKLKYNTPLTNEDQRNVNNELEQLQKELNNNAIYNEAQRNVNNELEQLERNYKKIQKKERLSRSRKAAENRVLKRKSK